MTAYRFQDYFRLRILEDAREMAAVEDLQRIVWPGNETEIIPRHLLLTAAHNGGFVIGAYQIAEAIAFPSAGSPPSSSFESDNLNSNARLVGFVFGFPGLSSGEGSLTLKHCSHMLGVHPAVRDQGIGFALKRAQWQMVRRQGIERITWTYDPLLSRNATLNVARLGAVCNTYLRNVYDQLRDGLNIGLPTDRFQVDWWINTQRVRSRLSKKPRLPLDLGHYLAAGALILNPANIRSLEPLNILEPGPVREFPVAGVPKPIALVEIPPNFQELKEIDLDLAAAWRMQARDLFEQLFQQGYLVTDFIYLPGSEPRSYYILTYGESTL